ncbi:ABC transporter ATP-binding protein [Aquitalea aquatica]|uniref:ABC transporter ATP-binding protein n=1 Tax=Aquitalea aquatica TaxID=3044273 RepID=UPI001C6A152B|nr:ATP-binding cassette domain-containing protein [Aquitalea magnusonii]
MPQGAAAVAPIIDIRNLRKRFGAQEVLKGVSFTAQTGDVVSLIGASGSGKSTLLRCMNMLEVPDSGQVLIAGEEVALKTNRHGQTVLADPPQVDRMRTRLGMVFQSFNLWPHMTVLENLIEVPIRVLRQPRGEAIALAEALLAKVGMAEKRHSYPAFLSGGQQQRVAIARALATRPSVMLFDEPTSALDPELVGEVLKVIRDLAQDGCTMVLVTHEMAFARDVSSKVMFLHQGCIEEAGTARQVFENPGSERCRQFVNAQFCRA